MAAAEEQRAAAARALAEVENRRAAASSALAAAHGADETISAIIANAGDIPDEAAKTAWLRLVASKAVMPTHEIVTAIGLRHILYDSEDPGRKWREVSRGDAWHAQGAVVRGGECQDRWLGGDGSMWAAAVSPALRLFAGGTPQTYPIGGRAHGEPNWIALPKGEPFHTSDPRDRQSPWICVPGGVRLRAQAPDNDFAKVAAAILRTR